MFDHIVWCCIIFVLTFATFTGLTDEKRITRLGFHYNNRTKIVRVNQSMLDVKAMNNTLRHLSHCVPIVLESEQSRRLLKYTFPTLYKQNAFDSSTRKQTHYTYSNNCSAPDAAHLSVMHTVTSLEKVLYDAVFRKVQSAYEELLPRLT